MGAIRFFDDVQSFREHVTPFLIACEAEHNLLFGLSDTIARDPSRYPEHILVTVEAPDVAAVALMTPPHNLVLSQSSRPHVETLADGLADAAIAVAGVSGPSDDARHFAEQWTARTGSTAAIKQNQRIYKLERVQEPADVSGAMRAAAPDERPLLHAWLDAFNREAAGEVRDPASIDRTLDWYFGGDGRGLHLWIDGGEPVSMAGHTGPTPNGIRIGPVYTPPERRARGYASAVTAAASRQQLDDGRRFCFLFTDLANPTSNSIYQKIGYEPVCDVSVYTFSS